MHKKTNLVWIDLEMTGLDPEHHVILEIASIITTKDLDVVAQGPQLVIQQSPEAFDHMDEWPQEQHTKSGLLEKVKRSQTTVESAAQQTLDFIKQYCEEGASPLCGNSVWQDRNFLKRHMPSVLNFLHYRIIDVSTVKELVLRWYAGNPQSEFEKKDTHRALDDILESIEELRHYKSNFFV